MMNKQEHIPSTKVAAWVWFVSLLTLSLLDLLSIKNTVLKCLCSDILVVHQAIQTKTTKQTLTHVAVKHDKSNSPTYLLTRLWALWRTAWLHPPRPQSVALCPRIKPNVSNQSTGVFPTFLDGDRLDLYLHKWQVQVVIRCKNAGRFQWHHTHAAKFNRTSRNGWISHRIA